MFEFEMVNSSSRIDMIWWQGRGLGIYLPSWSAVCNSYEQTSFDSLSVAPDANVN